MRVSRKSIAGYSDMTHITWPVLPLSLHDTGRQQCLELPVWPAYGELDNDCAVLWHSVPVDDLAEQADRLAAGQVREIHRCLRVSSSLQDAALRSHMATQIRRRECSMCDASLRHAAASLQPFHGCYACRWPNDTSTLYCLLRLTLADKVQRRNLASCSSR